MKNLVRISLAVLALGVFASAASAQTSGNVVWGALPGNGVTIGADFGLGVNDDAKIGGESSMYFGGRVGYGANMFTVYALGGLYPIGNDAADGEVTLGGGVAVHVINKAEAPVSLSLQGGVGYINPGSTQLNVIGGALIGLQIPSTGVAIKPWIMPRVHYLSISDFDVSEVGFGASGGLSVDMPMGLGFHLGLDWVTIGDPAIKPMTVGVGVHYGVSTGAM